MRTVLQNVVFTLLLLAAYSFFDRGRHSALQRQVDDIIETVIPRGQIANWVLAAPPISPLSNGDTTIVVALD